uniref:Uncharacterized protein n=1 Tax=Panagrolaimus superbus TaxID=310955 RepID=A0A914Y176_9BILA
MMYLFLRFKPQQPVGVTHYGNRRERHCRSGNYRVKQCSSERPQNTGGDRNTDTVVDKRTEQVLLHVVQRCAGNSERIRNAHQAMAHQGNRRGFNGNITAATHRNADIRLSQRWRVVNAVAHHCHLTSFTLQMFDRFGFTVRQHPGDHLINPCFFGDRIGGGWVIPGQHHQTISRFMQALQRRHAITTQRIAYCQQGYRFPVNRQQHRRCPLRCLSSNLRFDSFGTNLLLI